MDKCKCCEGTGKINCTTCNGEGKVSCSVCGGNGREIFICPTCTKGYVPDPRSMDDEPTLKCPDCHGEWKKDLGPCKECNGTGRIKCTSCEGTGKEECVTCKGTGCIDIESLCKSVINETAEWLLDEKCIYKDRITPDMTIVIFDAANRGVNIAAYVASFLCDDYEQYAQKNRDDYLAEAAEGGYAPAGYTKAISGVGSFVNWLDRDVWNTLQDVAEQGFVPALGIVASVYMGYFDEETFDDLMVEKDWKKALECWQKIISLKSSANWSEETIEIAERHAKYLPSIINGDQHAMLELGNYLFDLDVDSETFLCYLFAPRALVVRSFYNRIIEADDAPLMRELAKFYWDREWYNNAAQVYLKLVKHGDACDLRLMLELGEYLLGLNKEEEYTNGVSLLHKVVESGDVELIRELANFCYERKGVKDFGESKGIELYKKLADGRDCKSLKMLGDVFSKKDKRLSFIYFYRAAELGDNPSVAKLGGMYLDGKYVEKNEKKANVLMIRAAKAGNLGGLYHMGVAYLNGWWGVRKNEVEAKRLLTLAYEGGAYSQARECLDTLDDSIKLTKKGPSGIIVGKVDKGPLPNFLKKDYRRAIAGKSASEEKRKILMYAKIATGILVRLVFAGAIGFLFWWWFEGFNKEALPGMLEQVKGIRGGISKNLSLALMVSGGSFVALYLLTFILSKVSISFEGVVQVLSSLIACVPAVVLITSGHWGVGGWMALAIICAISAKFENKAHDSWWRWILMSIGLWVSGGFGMNGSWIISSVVTAFSMGILLKDEK